MTRGITSRSTFVRRVRNAAMALVTALPPLRRAVASRIAELDVGYRGSPIVGESWSPGRPAHAEPVLAYFDRLSSAGSG